MKDKQLCDNCIWSEHCSEEDKRACNGQCDDYSPVEEFDGVPDEQHRLRFYQEWYDYVMSTND